MYEFKDEYVTGIASVDAEHKRLFEIADEAYQLTKEEFLVDKYDQVRHILGELKEYALLHLFLSQPGTAFTREQLLSSVWNAEYLGETRTVDMHIRTLRQKLGTYGHLIETVRNVGYRLEAKHDK